MTTRKYAKAKSGSVRTAAANTVISMPAGSEFSY
jgi:hypothetical protein